MTYDEIIQNVEQDFHYLDITQLANESRKSPHLQAKYYTLYLQEKRKLDKMNAIKERVWRVLTEYYHPKNTITDEDELKALKLDLDGLSYEKTILVGEVEQYIHSDKNWIAMILEYSKQRDLVEVLKQIYSFGIKERNNAIRAAIDDERWKSGS